MSRILARPVAGRSVGAIPQSMASSYGPSIDEILFRYQPGREAPTFTRSSEGRYRDAGLVQQTAASDILRDQHYVRNENGILVRATRLEAARTNSVLRSEALDHADWTLSSVTVTPDDVVAPDGKQTAEKVEDTSDTTAEKFGQTVAVADDSLNRAASIFVKKAAHDRHCALQLWFVGGTTELIYEVQLNPNTGETDASRLDAPTRFGVEDVSSDWWRLWVVGPNNATGNTTIRYRFQPAMGATFGSALSSDTGFQHAWGAQLEGVSGGAAFPSSYIATTSSAVSRAADDLSYSIGFDPQEITTYTKLVELGSSLHGSIDSGLFSLGGGTGDKSFHVLEGSGVGEYRVFGNNGTSSGGQDGPGGISYGDVVEVRAGWKSNGDIFIETAIGGTGSGENSKNIGSIPSSWTTDKIYVNRRRNVNFGFADYISGPIIAPGVRTMDECRALAGTA